VSQCNSGDTAGDRRRVVGYAAIEFLDYHDREDTVSAERVREIFWNDIRFISAINVLGLPGAAVPVTLHDGKPIGVQLIAGRYREDLVLDAAAAIEKRAGVLVHRLWEQMG
jgi:amidase